jgi:hypothetical protein
MTGNQRVNDLGPDDRTRLYHKTLRRGRRIKRQRRIMELSVVAIVILIAGGLVLALRPTPTTQVRRRQHHHSTTQQTPTRRTTKPPTSRLELVSFRALEGSSIPLSNVDGAPVIGDGATWTLVSTPTEIDLVKISGNPLKVTATIPIVSRATIGSTNQLAQPVIAGHMALIPSSVGLFRVNLATQQTLATYADHLGTPQAPAIEGKYLWLTGFSQEDTAILEKIDPNTGAVVATYHPIKAGCPGPTMLAQGTNLWLETAPCGSHTHAHVIGFSTTTTKVFANYSYPVAHEFSLMAVSGELLWGTNYDTHLDIEAINALSGNVAHILSPPSIALGLGVAPTSTSIWSLGNREAVLVDTHTGQVIRSVSAPKNVLFTSMTLGTHNLWIRDGTGLEVVPLANS